MGEMADYLNEDFGPQDGEVRGGSPVFFPTPPRQRARPAKMLRRAADMKPATFPEARVLAAMARGGTLARKPSKTANPLHLPWELRDGGGGIVYYPAAYRRDNRVKEGDCPLWWAKKLLPLVERALLIADHPVFEKAARLYITDEGKALAWRLTKYGHYGQTIPCLHCDREPHEPTNHEYQPALKWAKEIKKC